MDKAIITIVIRDRVGIIAAVSTLSIRPQSERVESECVGCSSNHYRWFLQHDVDRGLLGFRHPFDDLLDGLETLGEVIGG